MRGDEGLQPGGQLAAAAGVRLQPCHARPQQQRRIWRLRVWKTTLAPFQFQDSVL